VEKGQVAALLGMSGSGKSTLLRCIAGLERTSGGEIRISHPHPALERAGDADSRPTVGMVFQHFNLYPHMKAVDNVATALRHVRHLSRADARLRATAELERVGLGAVLWRYPGELSGGQQQRVAIARALALEPDVMLFDEPTSSLDPETTGEVLDVMRRLAEGGMTMMVATHEMEFARDVADVAYFMDGGVVLESGPAKEFFRAPRSVRAKTFLARLLRHQGMPAESGIPPSDDLVGEPSGVSPPGPT
jgi:ABC-type polar amino acid transport system ATPase subunit